MRNRHSWTLLQFAIVLVQTILIYMVAGLVFSDLFSEEVVDLKENFYAHRGWFFSLAAAMIVVSIFKTVVLDGTLPDPTKSYIPLDLRCNLIPGAFTRRESYHKTLVVFGIVAHRFATPSSAPLHGQR
jgi:hypothetical protein